MLVITGATGNIGSKAADILLEKGEKVRVIGRDAARLQRFVNKGAEAAVGDLKDTAFLTRAFNGAEGVFAMIPPNYTTTDFWGYQDEVGESIVKAIADAKVQWVVNLSSQGAELPSDTGPIVGLHRQEERLDAREGVCILHLRPAYFMENLMMDIPMIHEYGIAGSAVQGDLSFAMIATKDIAAVVAKRLSARDFRRTSVVDLLGERDLSLDEAFSIIGRQIGHPDLKYVQFSYEDALSGMTGHGISLDVARLIIEMSYALNHGLFGVNRPRSAETNTPTSIEEFAATTFAPAFEASALKKAA